jgi:hypothetical protein
MDGVMKMETRPGAGMTEYTCDDCRPKSELLPLRESRSARIVVAVVTGAVVVGGAPRPARPRPLEQVPRRPLPIFLPHFAGMMMTRVTAHEEDRRIRIRRRRRRKQQQRGRLVVIRSRVLPGVLGGPHVQLRSAVVLEEKARVGHGARRGPVRVQRRAEARG